MSKHTPGPWTSSNQGWGDGMADVIGPNREAIARMPILVFCPSGDWQVIDDPEKQAEYSANRHLVEAAPDLLEALEALFKNYKELADSGDAGFWKLENTDCGKLAIEAIAKAKGE